MNPFRKSLLLIGLTLSFFAPYIAATQHPSIAVPRTSEDLNALPRKTASLDQSGIDKFLAQIKADKGLAAKVSSSLKSNPRETVERLFRLSSVQSENLQSMSDAEISEIVAPLIKAIDEGKLAQTKANYSVAKGENSNRLKTVIIIFCYECTI
jgi:hypothetical protein